MSKVFVLSLHRCATQSTEHFLRNAGFRTCHWPAVVDGVDYQAQIVGLETSPKKIVRVLRPIFENYDAIDDVPLPTLYKELDKAYPGSRFVAVYRNPFDWVESVRRHCAGRPFDAYERVQYWHYLDAKPLAIDAIADDVLIQVFLQHYRRLSAYFHGRSDFLLLDVGDPQIGNKLADFLGVAPADFPRIDYKDPTTHRAENTLKTLQQRLHDADIELAEARAQARGERAELEGRLATAEADVAATIQRFEQFAAEQQAGWVAVEKGIEWRLDAQQATHAAELAALHSEIAAATERLTEGGRRCAELTGRLETGQRWLLDMLSALDPGLLAGRTIAPISPEAPTGDWPALARLDTAVQRAGQLGTALYEQAARWRAGRRPVGNSGPQMVAGHELAGRLAAAEAELASALGRFAEQQRALASAEAAYARRLDYLQASHTAELAALRSKVTRRGPRAAPVAEPAASGMPLVSIVLPIYNQSYLAEQAIDGVLAQTYENWELIIVDDGSRDDLETLVRRWSGNRRVLFLRQPNQKLPTALNHGFSCARGELLTWTSADNIMLPTQLERLVAELAAHPEAGLVYSDYWAIDDNGQPLVDAHWRAHNRDPEIADLIRLPDQVTIENFHHSADNFIGASFLYRRSVADIVGPYLDDAFGGEDYDFWLRMHLVTQFRHIAEPLYKYRVHADTLTRRAEELGLLANIRELLEADRWRIDTLLGDGTLRSDGSLLRPLGQFHAAILRRCRPIPYSTLAAQRPDPARDGPIVIDVDVAPRLVDPADLADADILLCRTELAAALLRRQTWARPKRVLHWDGELAPGVQHAFIQAFADQVTVPATPASGRVPAVIDDAFRPSRILLLTEIWAWGGLENVVVDLADALAASGCDVVVASARGEPPAETLFAAGRIRTLSFHADEARFAQFLRDQAIEVVNYHHCRFAVRETRAQGVATVYTLHNSYLWMDDAARREVADGLAAMDRVIAVSRQAAQFAAAQFGVAGDRMTIVPNGLPDALIIEPARGDGAPFTVAVVGSLTRPKLQHVAIAGFEAAAAEIPEMRLRLIGAALDPAYLSELQAQIAASPARGRIELAAGLSRAEAVGALGESQVYLLPSLVEGCSMALLEAAAAGCVCIASDVGAARDLHVPGGPVVLLPSPLGELDRVTQQQFLETASSPLPEHRDHIAAALREAWRNYAGLAAGIPALRRRVREAHGMARMAEAYRLACTLAYRGGSAASLKRNGADRADAARALAPA